MYFQTVEFWFWIIWLQISSFDNLHLSIIQMYTIKIPIVVSYYKLYTGKASDYQITNVTE